MKKQYNALKMLVFGFILLCVGMQGVFAALPCEGTVYFKLPDGWKSAYAVAGGNGVAFKKSEYDGWLSIDASAIGGGNDAVGFNIEETGKNDCNSGHCATPMKIDTVLQMDEKSGFNCTDLKKTGELWISANPDPDLATTTYSNTVPPDVKYFYIFLPNKVEWKSSIPYMSIDGKKGEPLSSVPDRCGWFFKRYVDEEPPSNVLIYRDDDETMAEAIGMGGDWETAASPTPIDLKAMFDYFAEEGTSIYFVAAGEYTDPNAGAQGWSSADPISVEGECGYNLAALIYDTDAKLHGAFTCNPDWKDGQTEAEAKINACYYSSAPYNVVSSATGMVPCIGVTTGMVTEILPDDNKPALTDNGKKCFGNKADEAFKAMFNYTKGVNENYCVNLPFTSTDDGQYEFDSDNYDNQGATVPGGFYPAETTPTEFIAGTEPLPEAEVKRKAEGPVFFCANYSGNQALWSEGLRTIHKTEGVPISDLICNGPGWDGGIDCNEGHLFAGGNEFAEGTTLTATGRSIQSKFGVNWTGDGWAWGCPNEGPVGWTYYNDGTEVKAGTLTKKNTSPGGSPRWTSGDSDSQPLSKGGRNQHFCFESHAKFRYKKGLRFSFRGDDDIWVYIDKKLAVDLGGTHLAAPGYVNLDKFVGKSGSWTVGETYSIDIFFCDRRTTMSNVRIKTNMFIQQTTGLRKDIVDKKQGNEVYTLQYCSSGDGSCATAANTLGDNDGCLVGEVLCADLARTGESVSYRIETKSGDLVKGAEELVQPTTYFNGIDLSNRCDPKINKATLFGLVPNTYYLIATVRGKEQQFQFKVSGNVDIVTKPAWLQDEAANRLPGTYEFTSLALASTVDNPSRIPLFISSVMDQGDSLLLDMGTAVGQTYSLDVFTAAGAPTSDLTLEYKNEAGEFVTWSGKTSRAIGDGGVDTIYASVPMAMLKENQQSYTIKVNGNTTPGATITFFAPKLVFVQDSSSTTAITGDPETNERWTGSVYNFYLLALAPIPGSEPQTYEPCGDRCNFALAAGSMTSGGIVIDTAGLRLVNGRAMISLYSTKEFRIAASGVAANPATISITGPNMIIKADYYPIFFRNPPVPYPVFADMFDSRGKKPSLQMVLPEEFFSMDREYLDGIADSLVIYYNRPFYNSPDSLPTTIVVFWDGDEDSIVVTKDLFKDNMVCGGKAGMDDTLCLGRISISGIEFSKEVKTASPGATLKSYAKFMDRGRSVTEEFPGNINDRVAPIIKAASVYAQGSDWNKMTIELSEEVQVNPNFTKQGFSVFLNSANALKDDAEKYKVGVESPAPLALAGDKVTINFWSSSEKGLSPHTGDYVRFRADSPIWTDVAVPVLGTDETLRPSDDAKFNWNSPTDYNAADRLPSPWAPVTGEAETGVKSIVYTRVGTDDIPTSLTTVKGYPITDDFEAVKRDNPGVLGYFLQSDIYSIVYSDSNVAKYYTDPAHQSEVGDIYLEFELDVFTNLGGFVAHESKRIRCNDSTVYGVGHSCLDTQRNFFISWNTIASDGRLVGTGAFISKMKSAVHLGKKGTRAKMDKTKMWGVRRDSKFTGKVVNQ